MLQVKPERRRQVHSSLRVGSLPWGASAPLSKGRRRFQCVEFTHDVDTAANRHTVCMTHHWNRRAIVYLVLAIAGLIGTWTFNTIAIIERNNFFGDWFGSGPAVNSLTMDLFILAVAACVLIVVEGRRLGMKHLWAYIAFSGLTAIAFTFPLFLANRERRIDQLAQQATPPLT